MRFLPILIFLGLPLVALTFFVRIIIAAFSEKTYLQIRGYPLLHGLWGCFALAGAALIFLILDPGIWPPNWLERRSERKEVFKKIEEAGGWQVLRSECESLATNYPGGFNWFQGYMHVYVYLNGEEENFRDKPLPPTLAALKPLEVDFHPGNMSQAFGRHPSFAFIKIYGMHRTGGHSTPTYGLEIPIGPDASKYASQTNFLYQFSHRRELGNGVYEVY